MCVERERDRHRETLRDKGDETGVVGGVGGGRHVPRVVARGEVTGQAAGSRISHVLDPAPCTHKSPLARTSTRFPCGLWRVARARARVLPGHTAACGLVRSVLPMCARAPLLHIPHSCTLGSNTLVHRRRRCCCCHAAAAMLQPFGVHARPKKCYTIPLESCRTAVYLSLNS